MSCKLQRGTTATFALFMRPFDSRLGQIIIPLRCYLVFDTDASDGSLPNQQVHSLSLGFRSCGASRTIIATEREKSTQAGQLPLFIFVVAQQIAHP